MTSVVSNGPPAEAVTRRTRDLWSAGDFSRLAALLQPVAEQLCETAGVGAHDDVLDVACGSGNGAIAASRRSWARVTGLDFVPALLEHARRRATAERLEVEFVEGDAQGLPFQDASYDVVLSTFGAMFAPDHERAAAELLRVCRPGGRIALTTWPPDSLVGRMMQAMARRMPPPPGAKPPLLWGVEAHLKDLLGSGVSSLDAARRFVTYRFPSAEHFLEFMGRWFGPLAVTLSQLDEAERREFHDEVMELLEPHDGPAGLAAPAEYLEVLATRAA